MARGRKARDPEDDTGEIKSKDFAKALKYFREDILPAQAKVGEFAQEQSTAYKAIKKLCNIQPGAAKLVFKLIGLEEAKREDFLRCFNGLLDAAGIALEPDLVDAMQPGKGPAALVAKPRPKLVTVPASDGSESDLSDAAFGTGAAAMAAMKSAESGAPLN